MGSAHSCRLPGLRPHRPRALAAALGSLALVLAAGPTLGGGCGGSGCGGDGVSIRIWATSGDLSGPPPIISGDLDYEGSSRYAAEGQQEEWQAAGTAEVAPCSHEPIGIGAFGFNYLHLSVPDCYSLIINGKEPIQIGDYGDVTVSHSYHACEMYYSGEVPVSVGLSVQVVPTAFVMNGRNWRYQCRQMNASGGSGGGSGPGGSGGATSGTSAPQFSGAGPGTVTGFRNSMPLGSLAGGETAGLIHWAADDLGDPATYTPSILGVLSWTNVDIVPPTVDSNSVLRQVFHPEAGLANVTNVGAASFDVDFFPAGQVSGPPGGPYLPSDSPAVTWHFGRVVSTSGSTTNLRIVRTEGAAVDVSQLGAVPGGWVLQSLGTDPEAGDFLRRETRTSATNIVGSVTNFVQTNLVEDIRTTPPSTNAHVVRTYRDFPGGSQDPSETVRRLLAEERFIGGGASSEVTQYAYYDDPVDPTVGMLQSVQYPDGRWTKHLYRTFQEGTTTNIEETWEPLGDLPLAGATSNNCRVTVETEVNGRQVERVTRIAGTMTGRTVWPVPVLETNASGDGWETSEELQYASATECLTTVTRKYVLGTYGRRLFSVTGPDGVMKSYAYETNETGAIIAEVITNGTAASPDGVANLTTLERSDYDADGRLLAKRSLVCTSPGTFDTNAIEIEEHLYDSAGVETNVLRNGRSVFAPETLEAGRLVSVTDEMGILTTYAYDDFGRRYSETRSGVTTTNGYDLEGRVVSTVRLGSGGLSLASTRGYDASGEVAWETDERGLHTGYERSPSSAGGRIEAVTLPSDATRETEYFRDGRVKGITGTGVVGEQYSYGITNGGFQTETVCTGPGTARYRTTVSDWAGRIVEEHRPGFGGGDLVTAYGYEPGTKRLISREDPGLAIRRFLYDAAGQPRGEGLDLDVDGLATGGTNRITETPQCYGQIGSQWYRITTNLTYLTRNSGTPTVLSVACEQLGDLGPTTLSHSLQIDAFGAATDTLVTFNPASGQVTTTVDSPRSNLDAVTVSLDGRVLSQTSHTVSSPVLYGYDGLGRLASVTHPADGETTYAYDASTGELASVIDPTDRTTSFSYHGNGVAGAGQVDVRTDPGGAEHHFDYDLMGRVTDETGSGTYPVSYAYDGYGQMTGLTTYQSVGGGGDTTTWQYEASSGLMTNKVYASGPPVGYTYNDLGQVAARTSGRGITTTYGYNSAGDLTSVSYDDGVTPTVAYGHDRAGRRTSVIDAAGTRGISLAADGTPGTEGIGGGILSGVGILRDRDGLGRALATGAFLDGGAIPVGTLSRHYRADGRLMDIGGTGYGSALVGYQAGSDRVGAVMLNGGMTRLFGYDGAGRLTGVLQRAPDWRTLVRHDYNIDSAGRRDRDDREDGTHWEYGYNDRGEVTSGKRKFDEATFMPGSWFEYDFDDIGNRTEARRGGNLSGGDWESEFDTIDNPLNQIGSRSNPSDEWITGEATEAAEVKVNGAVADRHGKFFWKKIPTDNVGGPVALGVDIEARLAGAGPQGQDIVTSDSGTRLIPGATESLGHDADGNLTSDDLWSYEWDAENRLRTVTANPSLPEANRVRLTFDYDAQWRRIQKTVERRQGGAWVETARTKFVWDDWHLIAELDARNGDAPTRSYVWGPDISGAIGGAGGVGGLLLVRDLAAGAVYAPCYDGNGNVVALVAMDGSLQTVARYEYGPFGEPLRATGPAAGKCPFRFSSKYTDEETGLLYYGYRYYNPVLGRWISRDPLGESVSPHSSLFSANDSINRIDVLGLTDVDIEVLLHAIAWGHPGPTWVPPKAPPLTIASDRVQLEHAKDVQDILDEEARHLCECKCEHTVKRTSPVNTVHVWSLGKVDTGFDGKITTSSFNNRIIVWTYTGTVEPKLDAFDGFPFPNNRGVIGEALDLGLIIAQFNGVLASFNIQFTGPVSINRIGTVKCY